MKAIAAPYGAGNDSAASEIISVGESYAEHLALVFCETHYRGLTTSIETRKQGNVYSFNNPVTGLGTFLNVTINKKRLIPEAFFSF